MIFTVSSLEKIFPEKTPKLKQKSFSVFQNEKFNFQIAVFPEKELCGVAIRAESSLACGIQIRAVEMMPSVLAMKKGEGDKFVINRRKSSGVYPDLLRPMHEFEILRKKIWSAYWVTADLGEKNAAPGNYNIEFEITYEENGKRKVFGKCNFRLEVLPSFLPSLKLDYTCWFHYDCIAREKTCECFSEEYYVSLNAYIKSAVKHGMNTLYTPLFTPPLDTAVGKERKTVQLVEVSLDKEGNYTFEFARLQRFIKNARDLGIRYFEFSHLTTQWGAKFCPKIIVNENGGKKQHFGWHTPSDGEEYLNFLETFLKNLFLFCKSEQILDFIRFHISDEPGNGHERRCKTISELIRKYFHSAIIMDALTDRKYLELGIINNPVVATNHADKFYESSQKPAWVYYCSWQKTNNLSNRLFNMPSVRNRILGTQLYANGASGFLHWGFNFYNSILSAYPINPYFITDAGGGFESGDSYLVYPGNDCVYESIRHEVLYEGFTDHRALTLAERILGKECVIQILKKYRIRNYTVYPKNPLKFLKFRKEINLKISDHIKRFG